MSERDLSSDRDSTPSGAHIVLTAADGTEHEVTDAVGALFDLVVASMDWGSGFLTVDDAAGFVLLADLAGYKDPDAHYRDNYVQRGGPHHDTLLEQARAQVAAEEKADA